MSAVGFLFIWLFALDLEFVTCSCLALFNCIMLCTVSAFLGYGLGEAPRALWNGSRIVETIKHHLYQVKTTYDTWTLAAEDLASKLVQVSYLRSRSDTV